MLEHQERLSLVIERQERRSLVLEHQERLSLVTERQERRSLVLEHRKGRRSLVLEHRKGIRSLVLEHWERRSFSVRTPILSVRTPGTTILS